MTLLELTEPIFQYVCRLNRIARRGTALKPTGDTNFASTNTPTPTAAPVSKIDFAVARSDIKQLFQELTSKAASDLRLSQQVKKIELPLIFFVDSMISESGLPFAGPWNQNRIAYERQELAGDEKFFDLLEEDLKESGDDATERLGVYYVCIGLGFTGIYFKQPEFLRKTMLSIASRLRYLIETDQHAKMCPETYEAVDTRDLIEPASSRMVLVGMVFGCFSLAVLISYFALYYQASKGLNDSIKEILQQDLSPK